MCVRVRVHVRTRTHTCVIFNSNCKEETSFWAALLFCLCLDGIMEVPIVFILLCYCWDATVGPIADSYWNCLFKNHMQIRPSCKKDSSVCEVLALQAWSIDLQELAHVKKAGVVVLACNLIVGASKDRILETLGYLMNSCPVKDFILLLYFLLIKKAYIHLYTHKIPTRKESQTPWLHTSTIKHNKHSISYSCDDLK